MVAGCVRWCISTRTQNRTVQVYKDKMMRRCSHTVVVTFKSSWQSSSETVCCIIEILPPKTYLILPIDFQDCSPLALLLA